MKVIKLRTPVKCLKGHFNYLYYSVSNGYVKDVRFVYPFCECNNAGTYKQCGDDQQATGLKDTNDVEIYEGDIILISKWIKETIIFEGGAFGYYPNDDRMSNFVALGLNYHYNWFGDKSEKVVVIGNIYEGVNNAD